MKIEAEIQDKVYDGDIWVDKTKVELRFTEQLCEGDEETVVKSWGTEQYDSRDAGERLVKLGKDGQIYAADAQGNWNKDYNIDSPQSFKAKILKASADKLTVTFDQVTATYGDTLTINPTIQSAISNDSRLTTPQQFGAQFTYSLDGTTYMPLDELVPKLHVGSNEIRYRMSTTNYEDKEGSFTAEISNRTIQDADFTVQVTGVQTYDGNGRALQITYSNDILKNAGPKVSYSLEPSETRTYEEQLPELKNAGTYQVYYQITADNYNTYTSPTPITVQIDKAPMTVTAGVKNPERGVIYGDPMPEFEASYTGFVKNETKETALTGTPVMTCSSYTSNSGAGTTHTINGLYVNSWGGIS